MEQVQLRAAKGRPGGSRDSRRLRREGKVPGVVYGRELDTFSVAVDAHDLLVALSTEAGLNALISLDCDGEEVLTVAREVQRDPVRGDVIHLDFVKISLTETIHAEIGIEFTGVPIGVSEDGGILETVRNTVVIEALPTDIPAHVTVDVSGLSIGDSLKIADIPEVAGVRLLDDPDAAIATVLAPRLPEEEEVPEELLEGAEALVEGEEGEARAGAEEAGEGDEE
jgi:large subunit ribosomal protein L25